MFTWSLACAPPERLASTSLTFVFVDVPDPVWKTSIGNWSSWRPAATSAAAAAIAFGLLASSLPSSPLTRAAAPLMRPSQWIDCERDRLAGDGEVVDGLLGLAAVELLGHALDPTTDQPQKATSSRATPTASS